MNQPKRWARTAPALPILALALLATAAALLWPTAGLARPVGPAQPTATSTGVLPPPVDTATLAPPFATATQVPSGNVCPQILKRVPGAAISAALSNPSGVAGYNKPLNPARPEGPLNPLRTWLSIHVYAKPYHPLFNGLEFKVGCP